MELEKAIERCNDFINENKSRPIILHTAIETVIKELKNRIPKKKIEDILKNIQEEYELLLEYQSGKESNRTKYLRGKIHLAQELLEDK